MILGLELGGAMAILRLFHLEHMHDYLTRALPISGANSNQNPDIHVGV